MHGSHHQGHSNAQPWPVLHAIRHTTQSPALPRPPSYTWVDDDTIVACVLPPGLGPPPPKPRAPLGPKIEDNSSGKKSQARTYPDLLKSPYDERLFEYYTTSQLVIVSVGGGAKAWHAGAGGGAGAGGHCIVAGWCVDL